jgi:hypothetical protein
VTLLDDLGEVISITLWESGDPKGTPQRAWEFERGNVSVDWARCGMQWIAYPHADAATTIPAEFSARIDALTLPYGVELLVVVFKPRTARIARLTVDHSRRTRRSLYSEGMERHNRPPSWSTALHETPITTLGLRDVVPTDLLHVALATAAEWPSWSREELQDQPAALVEEWDRRLRAPMLAAKRGPYSVTDEHLRAVARVYLGDPRNPVQRVRDRFVRDGVMPSRTTARRWVEQARRQPWWDGLVAELAVGKESEEA